MQIRRKAVPRSWTRVAKNHVCQVQFLSLTGHSLQYQLTSANLPPALQTHSQSSIEVPAGCEISAQMRPIATDVARSVVCMSLCVCVCVCVGRAGELCKNDWTDRDTVWGQTQVSPRDHILDKIQITHGKGHFWHAVPECTAHCSPAAAGECACPTHAADECIRRRDGWQDGDAAFCQFILDSCYWPGSAVGLFVSKITFQTNWPIA